MRHALSAGEGAPLPPRAAAAARHPVALKPRQVAQVTALRRVLELLHPTHTPKNKDLHSTPAAEQGGWGVSPHFLGYGDVRILGYREGGWATQQPTLR